MTQDRESYSDDQDRESYSVAPTYRIIRFHQTRPNKTIRKGLSLNEARAWCNRADTHGRNWFDGFTQED